MEEGSDEKTGTAGGRGASRASRPHVVLTNVYGDGNKGGAAITIALISHVRRVLPDARVTLVPVAERQGIDQMLRFTLAAHPDVEIASQRPIGSGPAAGIRHALGLLLNVVSRGRLYPSEASEAIRGATAVIGKGGQGMRGNPARPYRHLLALWTTFYPLALAARCGRRAAVHGVTIGPFDYSEPSWRLARYVLRRLDRVEVRTSASVSECVRLGVDPARIGLSPDIVFSWPDLGLFERDAGASEPRSPRRLAVTIQRLPDHPEAVTLDWYEEVVRQLVSKGLVDEVVVVRHAGGPAAPDTSMARTLADRLAPDVDARFDDSDFSPRELLELYSGSVAVLGGRVHSAVFGLVSGSLAFPVDGQRLPKARDIFNEVDASDLVLRLPLSGRDGRTEGRAAAATIEQALETRGQRLQRLAAAMDAAADEVGASMHAVLGHEVP